jgi:hypothetical protein
LFCVREVLELCPNFSLWIFKVRKLEVQKCCNFSGITIDWFLRARITMEPFSFSKIEPWPLMGFRDWSNGKPHDGNLKSNL